MNNSSFGLQNIKVYDSEGREFSIKGLQEVRITPEEPLEKDLIPSLVQTTGSLQLIIKAKKHGTLLEKALYFKHSKKKRIRKKWSLLKILNK